MKGETEVALERKTLVTYVVKANHSGPFLGSFKVAGNSIFDIRA